MFYFELSDLNALLPEAYQIKAMDDARTGEASSGIADSIRSAASNEVDALLAPTYATPISPVPAVCKQAALWIALDMIYIRRSMDNKVVRDNAEKWRERLEAIGRGDVPLLAADSPVTGFDDWDPSYGVVPEDPDA